MQSTVPKGRFAPTPSGKMHLGNIFAALLAWLSARSAGGQVLLRIEDLDPARTSPIFTQNLLDDLAWLGLAWEEGPGKNEQNGPYLQSARTSFYEKQVAALARQGLVYPCFCSRGELHAANAPHSSDGTYLYNGRCRRLTPEDILEKQQKRSGALRVKVPSKTISFVDGCQGAYSENLAAGCGDFILRRSDGIFAYQLAAPLDDGAMRVTEVVRGRDLLASTARQIWLLQTLGYTPPRYFHHPLLLAKDGRRLSKRDKDLDIAAIRKRVKTPEPLLGKLAFLAGLLPAPEPVSARELIPLFSWGKVPKQDIIMDDSFWEDGIFY